MAFKTLMNAVGMVSSRVCGPKVAGDFRKQEHLVMSLRGHLARVSYPALLIFLYSALLIAMPVLVFSTNWAEPILLDEHGPIETTQLILYLVVALLFFVAPYDLPKNKWLLGVLCLLFAARELDINQIISDGGFWFVPENFKVNHSFAYTIVEIVGICVVLSIIVAIIANYGSLAKKNMLEGDPHQYMMTAAIVSMALSPILDGSGENFAFLMDGSIPQWFGTLCYVFEETVELMIPICLLFALLHYYKSRVWNV